MCPSAHPPPGGRYRMGRPKFLRPMKTPKAAVIKTSTTNKYDIQALLDKQGMFRWNIDSLWGAEHYTAFLNHTCMSNTEVQSKFCRANECSITEHTNIKKGLECYLIIIYHSRMWRSKVEGAPVWFLICDSKPRDTEDLLYGMACKTHLWCAPMRKHVA